MSTVLRVYAHWGRPPTAFGTLPATACQGTPGTPNTPPLREYWCELVNQATIDSPGPGIAGYGQSAANPADRFDLGYDSANVGAINFNVTKLCVLLVDGKKNDYDYTLITPSGRCIPVPSAIVLASYPALPNWPHPAIGYCWNQSPNIMGAKGIWKIEVRQTTGFAGVPTDGVWPNGVTQVAPYNSPVEGLLALEFEGDEVFPTTTTTSTTTPTTTTSTTTPTTTTSTTTPTTTTSTTTPTTTTSTTTPTTTTSTTTPQPPTRPSCLCLILLIIALALIAMAAIAFLAWACSGFANPAILVFGIVAAVLGLILLIIWILLCAALQCAALFVLIDTFTGLVIAMPIVAAILAFVGLPNCGIGALIDWGFFGIVLSALYKFGEVVGCIIRKS